MPVLLTEYKRS